jgi:hypothetical protein
MLDARTLVRYLILPPVLNVWSIDSEPAGEQRLARVYQRHDDSSLAVGFFDSSAYENDIGFGDGYHFVEGCYCKVGPRKDANTLHLHLPDYVIRHCPPFAYP